MPDKLKKLPRIVDVVAPTYQPSKTELEEDMRVRATFEEVSGAYPARESALHPPAEAAVSEGASALSYIIPFAWKARIPGRKAS